MPNNQNPSVKKYYDYANQTIDEQAILDKYNAATLAQFAVQREQNRQAENTFYNQMYNTQKTAMDTIRKANADAVATGASRGVQAANELSALLGLQQESVASATELAQTSRQTAQEETAAVLENVLNAYTQAQQERAQLVSQSIESASIDAQEQANAIAAQEASTDYERYLLDLKVNDPDRYNQILADRNYTTYTGLGTEILQLNLQNAINEIEPTIANNYSADPSEITEVMAELYYKHGLQIDKETIKKDLENIKNGIAKPAKRGVGGAGNAAYKERVKEAFKNYFKDNFNSTYNTRYKLKGE